MRKTSSSVGARSSSSATLDAVRVHRADDVGQPEPVAQPHGHVARAARARRTAPRKDAIFSRSRLVLRDRVDARPAHLGLQRRRRPLGDDAALVDDPDAVGEDVRLLEVLRREEHGHALLAAQARDLLPHRRAALRVEAGRRLVEEEHAREVDEREREVEPPLHPTRVALHLAVARLGEPDALEELVRVHLPLRLRDALERRLEAQVVAAGEERVERSLLERDPDHASAPSAPPSRRRTRRRARCPRSAAAVSSGRGRSWISRRRSGRGSRRSRPARPRGRSRRPPAAPSCTPGRAPRPRSRCPRSPPLHPSGAPQSSREGYSGSRGSFVATTGSPFRRYATSTESFWRYVPATPTHRDSQRHIPSWPSVFSSRSKTSVRPSIR